MSSATALKPVTILALTLMIVSTASFSAMNIFVRFASLELHTTQVVFIRNFFSVLLMLPWVLSGLGFRENLHTHYPLRHFWRAAVGMVGMQLWFYCVSTFPLNEVTALSFTAPIFTFIVAILFLGERAGWHRWGATFVGFAGAMVVLQPDAENMNPEMLIVLCATSMWAVAGTLVKSLTKTEPPERIVFYMALFMMLLSAFPAIPHWQTPSMRALLFILGVAICSTAAHICLVRAYAKADIVMLMPFDFFRLVFTAIFAYGVFHEVPTAHTWIGAGMIVASSAYIAYRESTIKPKGASNDARDHSKG